MQLKQYSNYQIDFRSKVLTASCAFMGLSLFMRALYYLGFFGLNDHHIGIILFNILAPFAGSFAYIYLLKFKRLNAPGLYGLIGAGFCIVCLMSGLFSGNVLRIILSIPWYLAAAAIFLATINGNTPDKLLSCLLLTIPIGFRYILLLFDGGLFALVQTLCDTATLATFALLPYAMIDTKRK